MGRQLAVFMSEEDEAGFLSFLRESTDVKLLESFAPNRDNLWTDRFSSELTGHSMYRIWNTRFEWTPTYAQVGPKANDPRSIGWWYVSNTGAAPLLEFSRSNAAMARAGRIYWAKDFSAPNGLSYDVDEFSRWVDSIWRWIRSRGKRRTEAKVGSAYFLPDALRCVE